MWAEEEMFSLEARFFTRLILADGLLWPWQGLGGQPDTYIFCC